jgi:hypothetical protein
MIKSILYERKNSSFLEKKIPRIRYISFVMEKNRTYLVKVTPITFIVHEVLPFMKGEKVHISITLSL